MSAQKETVNDSKDEEKKTCATDELNAERTDIFHTYLHVRHAGYDVRYTDETFEIAGYEHCTLCGEYDKNYSLITLQGQVVTFTAIFPVGMYHDLYVICGACSSKFGLTDVRRGSVLYRQTRDVACVTLGDEKQEMDGQEKGKQVLNIITQRIQKNQKQ